MCSEILIISPPRRTPLLFFHSILLADVGSNSKEIAATTAAFAVSSTSLIFSAALV